MAGLASMHEAATDRVPETGWPAVVGNCLGHDEAQMRRSADEMAGRVLGTDSEQTRLAIDLYPTSSQVLRLCEFAASWPALRLEASRAAHRSCSGP